MKVNIKKIEGNWDLGYVMDKHIVKSVFLGEDEYGHPRFDTERTEVGESVFLLKYRCDWNQVEPLAQCLYENAVPLFKDIHFIIPMAASNPRDRQPVTEVANALAKKMELTSLNELLFKEQNGQSLKNLSTAEEKKKAVKDSFSTKDQIKGDGSYNILLIDDLFHTGTSMEAACEVLRKYKKINKIYVAALTWR